MEEYKEIKPYEVGIDLDVVEEVLRDRSPAKVMQHYRILKTGIRSE